MSYLNVLQFIGGLGLFLFGMKIMADGLEKAAGGNMQRLIERLTGSVTKGVLVGAAVTAVIQSSSATTVMVVGFVNAGVMSLTQAIGVIMGANIGTTVTSQIIRLGDIDQSTWYLAILKPSNFSPVILAIGVLLLFAAKRSRFKTTGEILIGFGVLFAGMTSMEKAAAVLKELPQFEAAFTAFENPALGILAGAAVTALLQSSSASVGILQAATVSGALHNAAVVPIILGQNIGTCVTAMLSSIGANKNAKRAAFIHLIFNIIGTVVAFVVIYCVLNPFTFTLWDKYWGSVADRGSIANFHTIFNILNTLLLLPAVGLLQKAVMAIIPGKTEQEKPDKSGAKLLDERFLATPSVAISQADKSCSKIAAMTLKNIRRCRRFVLDGDEVAMLKINAAEKEINNGEAHIVSYLGRVIDKDLNDAEDRAVVSIFQIISDIERIGDLILSIGAQCEKINIRENPFSQQAQKELRKAFGAVIEIMDMTYKAYGDNNLDAARSVEPMEQVIDQLNSDLKQAHMERLNDKQCSIQSGIIFIEMLRSLSRISDHCSNIAIAVLQRNKVAAASNPHDYARRVHSEMPGDYKQVYEGFAKKYL